MHVLLDQVVLGDLLDAALAEPVHDALDEPLGRRRAGRDADGLDALEPAVEDLRLVVDQVRLHAEVARHVDQALRVRRVRRADHEHEVDLARERLDRRLPVGRGVADVVLGRPDDRSGSGACSAAMMSVVSSTRERRLREVGELARCCGSGSSATSSTVCTSTIASGASPMVPDDLLVPRVADQEDREALAGEALRLVVHLGHERAGRVDRAQPAQRGVAVHFGRHAVRRDTTVAPSGTSSSLSTKIAPCCSSRRTTWMLCTICLRT